jgi:aspartate ammonia-lyase
MRAVENTDKPLWDSEDGMQTVFVTKEGEGIGISHAGRTHVMKARFWVEHMEELDRYRISLGEARARISKLEGYIADKAIEDYKK